MKRALVILALLLGVGGVMLLYRADQNARNTLICSTGGPCWHMGAPGVLIPDDWTPPEPRLQPNKRTKTNEND